MSRRILGPFGRVEGDLEVTLEIEEGVVRSAQVSASLYRGFEQMLRGKAPGDALVYTPRICGICSVAQSAAAAMALADAQGITPPPNGALATNLVQATENLADHLTHFYLFFMPDFAHAAYAKWPWHGEIARRFTALRGEAAGEVLRARAEFLHLMGLLAGKWPHSLAIQPGGTTRALEPQEQARALTILHGFRRFLERVVFADDLEVIAGLDSESALRSWAERAPWQTGDLRRFLHLSDQLGLHRLGRGVDRFMSYGAYGFGGEPLFRRGLWHEGDQVLDPAAITEDLAYGWLVQDGRQRHPSEGVTQPDADAIHGYSWCKAPRLDGAPVEVGALARQVVQGHPLIRDLVRRGGGNVRNRVIARMLELALVVPCMEPWMERLVPGEPYCLPGPEPGEARGLGLVEAARGSLGHWFTIRQGRLHNYQIIAPTTWNFSPRDAAGTPGPLEQALAGILVDEKDAEPLAVQHIVRSFDPCMVCTVH